MTRRDNFPARHEDEHVFILKYFRYVFFFPADQLGNPILRIVFAIEPGISPRRRQLARRNYLRAERDCLQEQQRADEKHAHASHGDGFQIHDPSMFRSSE